MNMDEVNLRCFVARVVGTIEGTISALEIENNALAIKMKKLYEPIIKDGVSLLYPPIVDISAEGEQE